MADGQKKVTGEIYEIKLRGYLDRKWSEWFYDMTITHEPDDFTTLYGSLPDQAVLHSILERIRDMNLILINVKKVADAIQGESDTQNDIAA